MIERGSLVKHKYNPDDFTEIMGLKDDLSAFYVSHEEYTHSPCTSTRFAVERHAETLFFTLKHRKLEGAITCIVADEILSYVEDLLYDG